LPGITAGERFLPIDSAGLYVPQGRGSFPSMLYMLAVPALVAGVPRVCIVTPPGSNGTVDPACLYAARICEIKEVYRVGGAQAIAALAYGTESIKPVVKIVGPGSAYVTAAKRALYGKIDVGVPAGPSDSIVLADEKADPYRVALDLMTEAEHGSDSAAILVTDSKNLAEDVKKHMTSIIDAIPEPRKKFLTDVFSGYGGIILAKDMNEAAEIVNLYAPEHLQIATRDPARILNLVRNAGEILLGQDTPFSIANYTTGPNAVLPTGGMAKTYSPVSVRDFMKSSSIIYADKHGLKSVTDHVIALADYEGFSAHSGALKMRKTE
ncbi:MAG: histidinol dehydrogenase, partial [Spirochaetaceae bacterium]|nr:histidinol dehydrogenase [Spirochaetaceae bacterium]